MSVLHKPRILSTDAEFEAEHGFKRSPKLELQCADCGSREFGMGWSDLSVQWLAFCMTCRGCGHEVYWRLSDSYKGWGPSDWDERLIAASQQAR